MIIGVVYIHAYNQYPKLVHPGTHPRGVSALAVLPQFYMVGMALRFAVPMFFAISGYLFFVHKRYDMEGFAWKRRYQARVRSILLPYILWNVIEFGVLFGMYSLFPAMKKRWPWFAFVLEPSPGMIFDSLVKNPIAFQLWYLRDLLILVVFVAPVVMWLYRCRRSLVFLIPAISIIPWFLNWWPLAGWSIDFYSYTLKADLYIANLDGVIFFPLGAALALLGVKIEKLRLSSARTGLLLLAALALNAGKTYLAWNGADEGLLTFLFKLGVPLNLIAFWFAYDWIEERTRRSPLWSLIDSLGPYSMWIYCAHEPLMGCALENMLQVFGWCVLELGPTGVQQCKFTAPAVAYLSMYIIFPILWLAILVPFGYLLSYVLPFIFATLTGGRGGASKKAKRKGRRAQELRNVNVQN
eukprot:g4569.t1